MQVKARATSSGYVFKMGFQIDFVVDPIRREIERDLQDLDGVPAARAPEHRTAQYRRKHRGAIPGKRYRNRCVPTHEVAIQQLLCHRGSH